MRQQNMNSNEDQTPRFIREALHKITQIVLQSRIDFSRPPHQTNIVNNKWFHLVLPDMVSIREIVDQELKRDRDFHSHLQVRIFD